MALTAARPPQSATAARRSAPALWRELLIVAVLTGASHAFLYLGRGLDVPDEGLLLHVAERIASGQVPYRDVYFIYTPGLQYTLALLFRLFGPSLTVEHALLLTLAVAMAVNVYALARRLSGSWPLAASASAIAVLAGLSSYRFLLGLLVVAALTAYAANPSRARLVGVGVLVGVTFLFAQEVGLYALGTAWGYLGLVWLCSPARWRGLGVPLRGALTVIVGASTVLVPWLALLAAQGALVPMLDATVRVAFQHQPQYMHVPLPPLLPLVPNELDANVVYGPPPYLLYVKCLLYLPFVAVAAGIAVFLLRLRREGLTTSLREAAPALGFATLALATLANRADYYHLRQMLPAILVLLAWLLGQASEGRGRPRPNPLPGGEGASHATAPVVSPAGRGRARAARTGEGAHALRQLAVLLPLVPLLVLSFGEAKQWRHDQDTPLVTARGQVRVHPDQARDLAALFATLDRRTAPGEPIFVWPAETAVYFLVDRHNPTRFGQLVPTEAELLREHDDAVQHEMIAAIDAANVRWVVVAPTENVNGMPFAGYAPLLAAWLDANYWPAEQYGYWTLRQRRQ